MNGNDDVLTLTSEEATKLKTCGLNFILSVTLLRIIEMLIYFDRNLIIDQEGSLGRVFQVIQYATLSTENNVLTMMF